MFHINKITSDSTVDFAAEELKKYLRMMMPEGGDIKIAYAPDARDGFRLGLMEDFGLDTSDAADTALDDVVYMDCDTNGGVIAGSNARSVLLAVYEYLRQLGCRWLFPGVDGEYIPMKDITPVKYRKMADSRVRGNCIEGYTSQHMLCDFIEFMPKVGLNTFMNQFNTPYTFHQRQYNHYHNEETRVPEPISREQSRAWLSAIECEIAKRGILFHACGHGFTVDPFGLDSSVGWTEVNQEDYGEELMKNYALLDGKRIFFGNRPMNTQLCMSNPEVRRKVVDYATGYLERHSNIDYLHIWLADGENNHCECPDCVKATPSDWYITLLNELDESLSAKGIDSRIVFIVYVDTMWSPIKERLNDPERFTLMLAPITRDYTKTFDPSLQYELRPYERNKLSFPTALEEYIAYYGEWKKMFSGSRFIFEYHFWRPQHFDLSGRVIAKRIYDDVVSYRALGEEGILECGSLRSFFPNGFAFYTFARSLFDASLSLSDIERDYYSHAYGEDHEKFARALSDVAEALPYTYIYPLYAKARPEKYMTADAAQRMAKAREATAALSELVQSHYNYAERVRTVSVRMLEGYATYLECFIDMMEQKSLGNNEAARQAFGELTRRIGNLDIRFESCFDVGQTLGVIEYNVLNL